jgi:8-oxo-dGTP pyrophosphatase MutT (NUDIX family)
MKAAVLVPLYEDGDGRVRVILTRRPDDMRTHAGDVVFPGGMVEDQDSGPVSTAVREAEEEIGLSPGAVIEVIGGLAPVTTRSAEMIIVPVVARVDRPADLVLDPHEVAAVIEPEVEELLDEGRWVREDFAGRPLWFFEFPEGILWGATAFMMRDLLAYLR